MLLPSKVELYEIPKALFSCKLIEGNSLSSCNHNDELLLVP